MAGPPGPAALPGPRGLPAAFCLRFTHRNDTNPAVWAEILPPAGRDPFVFRFFRFYSFLFVFTSRRLLVPVLKIGSGRPGGRSFFVFSFFSFLFVLFRFISFFSFLRLVTNWYLEDFLVSGRRPSVFRFFRFYSFLFVFAI